MDTFYRAKLTLERVEPFTDKYDNLSERRTEIATVSVTGDTPGDAMTQIHDHAGTLYEWHDQPAPAVDEAFPALVLGDLPARIRSAFEGVRAEFSPGGRAAEANRDSDGEHAPTCHCSTTRHEGGVVEIHPDADCPIHGEHCKRPNINVPPRTDEPLIDGLTQAERDLLAERHREAGFGRGLYLPVTDEADDLGQASTKPAEKPCPKCGLISEHTPQECDERAAQFRSAVAGTIRDMSRLSASQSHVVTSGTSGPMAPMAPGSVVITSQQPPNPALVAAINDEIASQVRRRPGYGHTAA